MNDEVKPLVMVDGGARALGEYAAELRGMTMRAAGIPPGAEFAVRVHPDMTAVLRVLLPAYETIREMTRRLTEALMARFYKPGPPRRVQAEARHLATMRRRRERRAARRRNAKCAVRR